MLVAIIVFGIIGVDQAVKFWVTSHMRLGQQLYPTNRLMGLFYVQNDGAAWSILRGQRWFFIAITLITVSVIVYILWKNWQASRWLTSGLSLILGGALGNFIDRVRLGYVVDMFQFHFIDFPIFNVADAALTIGVICLLIYIIKDDKKEKEVSQ